ncbi:CubicO group peptidase (beta-lactamase class C family) [Kineococcus xinjiangensis]|uniref:CubicO group peptidase (Beta-lactamase class C family) n=1 Tax=Kineococcus xinjiangensis TaxID=512762 RepID=A0A2S6IDW3_9ACTN|nr:serine hydrolase domain-containing protein [Kineococcus xinjiangensis]PPK92401.1 CubicO group peptidase (beta-lactamase class C family) [Kineococcus xinjiangensis]
MSLRSDATPPGDTSLDGPQVGGWVAPGYEGVREAFAAQLAAGAEAGASFAATAGGRPVVDLHGGVADSATGRPWEADTATVVFSGTKGVMSLCLLLLADRGLLDYDRPLASYWPEFGAHGKGATTVREALSHQAGVPAFRDPVGVGDLADHDRLAGLLAAQEPFALDRPYYHALTHGWITGELLRRVDGRDAATFIAEELSGPLGLDLWVGLPEELEPRVSVLELRGDKPAAPPTDDPVRAEVDRLVETNPPLLGEPFLFNERAVHAAQVAGAGGIATARSVARLYSVLACDGELEGRRWLSEDAVRTARTEVVQWANPDGWPNRYSVGFQLQISSGGAFGPLAEGVGHGGFGGSQHGYWPGTGVSFSYCPNRLVVDGTDQRAVTLLAALHSAWRGTGTPA